MSKSITIGKTIDGQAFKLPLDFATESCAIIARKGAGKTHVGRVLAEDFIEHLPVVIIDPLDVWWGLRLTKDGKGEGRNFVIFGGSHGDLPLVETAGKHFADLIVDRGISAIFSVGHLSLAAQRRFVADFGERLFERKSADPKHRTAVLVIIDEADSFAPQRVLPDMTRCCGVIDRMVRRGRALGIGTTCISQRPAVLNKDVLTQSEILICLQVTAPQDRDALNEWVKSNADKYLASDFMETLPALPRGRAWVWSPSRLQVFEQVNIRDTETYDSSYTPKVGERRGPTPKLTPVDIKAIGEQMAAVVKEAEANDPTALKKRVKALESELAKAAKKYAAPDAMTTARAVDDGFRKGTSETNSRWIKALDKARKLLYEQVHQNVTEAISGAVVDAIPKDTPVSKAVEMIARAAPEKIAHAASSGASHMPRSVHRAPLVDNDEDGEKLGKAHRLILTALAQHGNLTKTQTALIAGYSAGGGGFLNPLGRLRTLGYVATGADGSLSITESGLGELGEFEDLPSGPELRAYWGQKLGKAHRLILEALSEAPDYTLDKEELARIAGYSAGGGGFLNPLGKLRTLELVSGSKDIVLAEELR